MPKTKKMQQETTLQKNSTLPTQTSESKYINLMTDYGLKSVLKIEELAIQFLNEVLKGIINVQKITYLDKGSSGKHIHQSTTILELLCEDDTNQEFIIEIQRVKQENFMDRSLFYTSTCIQSNAPKDEKGTEEWKFKQKPLIFIGLLDFEIPNTRPGKFKHIAQLCDIEGYKVLYKKLTYIFLELPKFANMGLFNSLHQLTNLGKWLYTFKNLHEIKKLPPFLNEAQFQKILKIAEVANMTKEQLRDYERSLKQLRDEYAIKTTAHKEGKKEGMKEGEEKIKLKIVQKLLKRGNMSVAEIADVVYLDEADVLEIKKTIDVPET